MEYQLHRSMILELKNMYSLLLFALHDEEWIAFLKLIHVFSQWGVVWYKWRETVPGMYFGRPRNQLAKNTNPNFWLLRKKPVLHLIRNYFIITNLTKRIQLKDKLSNY